MNFREKYYAGDISLIHAALGFDLRRIAGLMENILFAELETRGYTVYVGKLGEQEIDFIGIRGVEKIYVQVTYLLGDKRDVIEREFGALAKIPDQFPKYVVSLDEHWAENIDGIRRAHLADFLTAGDWYRT